MTKQTSKPQRLVRRTGPGTVEHSVSMMIKFATPSITRVAALSALVARLIMLSDTFAARIEIKGIDQQKPIFNI